MPKLKLSERNTIDGAFISSGYAHDNEIVSGDEARFIFDTVMSMLRFVRSVELDRYEPLTRQAA